MMVLENFDQGVIKIGANHFFFLLYCRSTLEESSGCSLMNSRLSAVLMMTQSSFGTFWTCQCLRAHAPQPEPTPTSQNEIVQSLLPAFVFLFTAACFSGFCSCPSQKATSTFTGLSGGLMLLWGSFRARLFALIKFALGWLGLRFCMPHTVDIGRHGDSVWWTVIGPHLCVVVNLWQWTAWSLCWFSYLVQQIKKKSWISLPTVKDSDFGLQVGTRLTAMLCFPRGSVLPSSSGTECILNIFLWLFPSPQKRGGLRLRTVLLRCRSTTQFCMVWIARGGALSLVLRVFVLCHFLFPLPGHCFLFHGITTSCTTMIWRKDFVLFVSFLSTFPFSLVKHIPCFLDFQHHCSMHRHDLVAFSSFPLLSLLLSDAFLISFVQHNPLRVHLSILLLTFLSSITFHCLAVFSFAF